MPVADYIKTVLASKFGGPLEQYSVTRENNKSLASAYLGTAQEGLASTAFTKVLLATESFDIGSNFASYKYTCPVTGYYHFDFSVYLANDGGTMSYGFGTVYVDGVRTYDGNFNAPIGGETVSNGSRVAYFTAGQYLELYAYGVTASSTWKIRNAASTFLSVHLIST